MAKTPDPELAKMLRELGSRIRARRAELEISQERLAARAGVHWTYVGQVERGQRNPSTANLIKLAYGLQLDAGKLVSGLPVPTIDKDRPW
ncbi:helix-turn-helix transcriptional regulator [Amycolatopsis minnesotensis]|uniref:HTH cro/C1-type domain-containing protein n=1 Tax=Amycolatopsis minnesotensis TaxID=337894 RepID=A0ABP5EG13_9PSEU